MRENENPHLETSETLTLRVLGFFFFFFFGMGWVEFGSIVFGLNGVE